MSPEETSINPKQPRKTDFLKRIKPIYVLIIIFAAISVFSLYGLYSAQQELKTFKTDPTKAASREVQELVNEVAKLIELPKDETPTVATVTDPAKLSDQAFFTNAKEGDKVLIYNTAKKAILYRPSEQKVLNFAPINIGNTNDAKIAGEKAQEPLKITILNGTAIAGLAGRYQKEVENKVEGAQIASIGNATSKDVEKTFIVDSKGDKEDELKKIAETLKIETGTLPSNQLKDDVDFVIVVGADKSSI